MNQHIHRVFLDISPTERHDCHVHALGPTDGKKKSTPRSHRAIEPKRGGGWWLFCDENDGVII